MKVWSDQEYCTGDGLCEELCSAMFQLEDDGLAYVKENGVVPSDRAGREAMVAVSSDDEEAVREAVQECAGECIFIEE